MPPGMRLQAQKCVLCQRARLARLKITHTIDEHRQGKPTAGPRAGKPLNSNFLKHYGNQRQKKQGDLWTLKSKKNFCLITLNRH